MSGYISINQPALATPFDNSTNGFLSTDVQGAIEEAKNSLTYTYLTGTSTLTRTANTFTTVAGMSVTPPAGTYLVIWNAQIQVGNVNGQGEVAIFNGGTQITVLTKQIELEVALLLGLIGTARLIGGADCIVGMVSVNGSQTIDVRYRSVDGQTVTITRRTLVLVKAV